MFQDIADLANFYHTPLGDVTRRFISHKLRTQWTLSRGEACLGVGYAIPYLELFRPDTALLFSLMPEQQGITQWPKDGPMASVLADLTMLPFDDSSLDRILVIHALEYAEYPSEVMAELWRILKPGGRLLLIVPNRRGIWARVESTPFGYGQPYSKGQLRDLLRESFFTPLSFLEALYCPPFSRPFFLKSATFFEKMGGRCALPGAGVHIVDATKQVYRPVLLRHISRKFSRLMPALGAIPSRSPSLT